MSIDPFTPDTFATSDIYLSDIHQLERTTANMLRLPNNLLLLYPFLTSSAVSAWIYTPSQGFGPAPEDHAALFLQANQNPNATASAPFQLSGQLYNLTVNVTELTPTGADTNITNPRVISTVYSLEWPGDSSLNATLEEAQGGVPRLCATIPSSPFSASITNGYIDAGDCSGALGEDCVNALEASSYESSAGCSRPLQADDECRSKWPNGGLATSCKWPSVKKPTDASQHALTRGTRSAHARVSQHD